MLRGSVVSTFFKYGIPWTLGLLLVSSAGIVDGFFIGRVEGTLALAAMNIVSPLYSVFGGFVIVLASGGGVRCAYYRGKKLYADANAIFSKIIVSIFGVSIVIAGILLVFLEPISILLGANDALMPYITDYMSVLIPFLPIYMLAFGIAYFVRVDERPCLASVSLGLAAVINIVLDYFCIVRLGMGIRGAAYATGIGCVCSLLLPLYVHFIYNKHQHLRFTLNFRGWADVLRSAWNGISEMINEFSTGLVIVFINVIMMLEKGSDGVAAFTVINYMNWFCLTLAYGFSDSLAPLVSANIGAKLFGRSRKFLYTAMGTVLCIGVICFMAGAFFSQGLISIFIPVENEATKLADNFMYVVKYLYLFGGINIVFTAYFTGLLQATASAVVAIMRSLVMPISLLIVLPKFWDSQGVALALPLAEAFTLLVALLIALRMKRHDEGRCAS